MKGGIVMMTRNDKYVCGGISGYTLDDDKQTIVVYFDFEETQGIVATQSLTFPISGEDACEFFGNLPIFTRDGEVDFERLEGIRVGATFTKDKHGWEIAEIELDSLYYAIHTEDDGWYGDDETDGRF